MDLILDAAHRLGLATFELYETSDAIQILPDPLAMSNRHILRNVTSRPATVHLPGFEAPLHLSPYGSAVVEIRQILALTETIPVTIPVEASDRVTVVALEGESEAEFAARQASFGGVSNNGHFWLAPTAHIPQMVMR